MPAHALIIDDNPMNIDVLILLLNREGVSYTSATSPMRIMDALTGVAQVDVVFLDLEFPNDDGLKLIADLKQQPTLVHTPIVAYTVHTSEIDEARKAGFHSFLGKPLNLNRFPDQLQRILAGMPVWEVF